MARRITAAAPAVDFTLDVTFAVRGSAIGELMNDTSDNCGSTGESACAGCTPPAPSGGDDD